jgi:hypothetical protein
LASLAKKVSASHRKILLGDQEIRIRREGIAMTKKINRGIKAHFLRNVLIVLSLVAVFVIPFALAQRTNKVRQSDGRYGSRTPSYVVRPMGVAGEVGGTPAATPSCPPSIDEGFNDITSLPGWVMINHSEPLGKSDWFQGEDTVFPAFDGAPTAYIAANFFNTSGIGTISNWLLTPVVSLRNDSTLTFYTRTEPMSTFPDRLQVRMSINGSSTNVGTGAFGVGDFFTLLLDINPTYTVGGYPETWTQFTVNLNGLPPFAVGRLAFRYFVENGGPDGTRSDYIGIDRAVYTLPCATPTPTATATPTATPGTPTPTPTPGPTGRYYPTPRPHPTPLPRPTP